MVKSLIDLIAVLAIAFVPNLMRDSVDMIELNHLHDASGELMYDQAIFYAWYPDEQKYHVREWCLIACHGEKNELLVNHRSKRVEVRLWDSSSILARVVTSETYRETWTQVNPSINDYDYLPGSERLKLARSRRPIASVEQDTQEHSLLIEGGE